MSFLHPQWLALLALPVILAFWEWVRPGQPLVMPFDHGTGGRGRILNFLVLTANCLPAGLLAMAIIFLAHPITYQPPEVERQLTNIQIVLDTSGSMREKHGDQTKSKHSRFDSAMESIETFLHHRKGDAFGLTIFSRNYIHWVPLTLDTDAIVMARPFIAPNVLPDEFWGGTFIGKALYGAADHLSERPIGDRMIILLTDGESSDIRSPKDVPIIADMKAKGITVFAVFLTDEAVDQGLINICRSSGGEAFNALSKEALDKVFTSIDQMKKVVVLEKKPRAADYYDPFFVPALALLAAAVFALFGLRFNPW